MDSVGDAAKLTEENTTAGTLPDKTTHPLEGKGDDKDEENELEPDKSEAHVESNELVPSNAHNIEKIIDNDFDIETDDFDTCTNSLIEPFQPLCEDINTSKSNSESETDQATKEFQTNSDKYKHESVDHDINKHESVDQTEEGAADFDSHASESELKENQEEVRTDPEIDKGENNVSEKVS